MDLNKIFLKDACPTTIGGQAVMEGVMMRGTDCMATSIRLPDGRIHIKTQPLPKAGAWMKIPVLRGVFAFITSLSTGMKTLIYSADVLEEYTPEEEFEGEKQGAVSKWIESKFGEKAAWNFAIYAAVAVAILLSVGIFILLPTLVVNLLTKVTTNRLLLNLAEGVLRICIFIGYIAIVGRMKDIRTTFEYHGAEHKTIHCFENNLELTPENAQEFYTLHPRCGTSFLMFVMIISLILFSLFGWPNIWVRLLSRILLIPVVAGLSYELLKWAGRSDNIVVKVLSMPGLFLQKLTTREPSKEQLEIAIASMKAVLVDSGAEYIEGICDKDAKLIEEHHIKSGPDGKEVQANSEDNIESSNTTNIKEYAVEEGIEDTRMIREVNVPVGKDAREVKSVKDKETRRRLWDFFKSDGDGNVEEEYVEDEYYEEEYEEEPRATYKDSYKDTHKEKSFFSRFVKEKEEPSHGGRAKNAAGIPLWDSEEEIKKAKTKG